MKTSKKRLKELGYEVAEKIVAIGGQPIYSWETAYRKTKLRNKEDFLIQYYGIYIIVFPDFTFITMLEHIYMHPLACIALGEEIKKLEVKEND